MTVWDALQMRPGHGTLSRIHHLPSQGPLSISEPSSHSCLATPFLFSPVGSVLTNFTSFCKYTFNLYSCKAYLLQRRRTPPKASSSGRQVPVSPPQDCLLKPHPGLPALTSDLIPTCFVSSPLCPAHSNQQSRI